jgi:hypothetical protein
MEPARQLFLRCCWVQPIPDRPWIRSPAFASLCDAWTRHASVVTRLVYRAVARSRNRSKPAFASHGAASFACGPERRMVGLPSRSSFEGQEQARLRIATARHPSPAFMRAGWLVYRAVARSRDRSKPAFASLRRGILRMSHSRLVYRAEARRRRAKDGGPDRDRTGDLMNAIHARSQLRYWPTSGNRLAAES